MEPRPLLTAEWRTLLILTYVVEPRELEPLVPRGTELDTWDGTALASAVGFRFIGTRLAGMPVPFHRDFVEVNLRFYVRRELPGGTRRGVVFVRELVPRPAVSALARLLYGEPYRTLPVRAAAPRAPSAAPGRVTYAWRTRAGWQRMAATAAGEPRVPPPGSLERFTTERHFGYTRRRGSTLEYAVEHAPWRVWSAEGAELAAEGDPWESTWGEGASAPRLRGAPLSALIAEGSAVAVSRPRRLPTA
jgi:uncharacterized protein YqjF (DUF2071 family)